MKCGPPPYLLPEVVADSVAELARRCGVSVNSIRSYVSHRAHGTNGIKYSERYVCVEVEEGDDDDK